MVYQYYLKTEEHEDLEKITNQLSISKRIIKAECVCGSALFFKQNYMKIIGQSDDKTFVIQLEEQDSLGLPYIKEVGVNIVHDYIAFDGFTYYLANINHGQLPIHTHFQIPIRSFQQVILPLLNETKYLKDEHFDIDEDDHMRYDDCNEAIFFNENGRQMVAFKMKGDKIFSKITRKTYELIKKGLSNE